MKKDNFKFYPHKWMGNTSLRAVSPAARGLWIDILCLCHGNAGYLILNGHPIDDATLSRLVGVPVSNIKKLMMELGEAGIFEIDDKGLYVSSMRKDSAYVAQAKIAGQRGQVAKKAKVTREVKTVRQAMEPITKGLTPEIKVIAEEMSKDHPNKELVDRLAVSNVAPQVKFRKPSLEWWKTPAGWARTGAQQAISPLPNEDKEAFKYRVAERLGDGQHVEALTPQYRKKLEAKIEKEKAYMPKPPNSK